MSYETEEITPTVAFPKLMENSTSGEIILFETSGKGTVIVTSDPARQGKCLTGLTMAPFEDYVGVITLNNTPE